MASKQTRQSCHSLAKAPGWRAEELASLYCASIRPWIASKLLLKRCAPVAQGVCFTAAVGGRAGKDHADGARSPALGQGSDEIVDGLQVLHQHERHAGVGRQGAEELGERFETSGGRADPHHNRDGFLLTEATPHRNKDDGAARFLTKIITRRCVSRSLRF